MKFKNMEEKLSVQLRKIIKSGEKDKLNRENKMAKGE